MAVLLSRRNLGWQTRQPRTSWLASASAPGHGASVRSLASLSSAEIRERFVNFFVERQHSHVPSSSLVPQNDRSLLFTNAGMVQFKDAFLGRKTMPHGPAVTVQRCMRAGGKHNDLDNVGYTPRHHTFFEMLGNFSFGQYFKREAITYAWQFLVHDLQLPPDRLRVTILQGDEESYKIWNTEIGLPADRILQCDATDNFWSMGDGEGPCGPCTEIFWDLGADAVANPDDRWLEIWNLVFMQHHRHADGSLARLLTPCVDTGMGLERVAAVLQGKANNYDIDTFSSLSRAVLDLLRQRNLLDPSKNISQKTPQVRIIADHVRACCFLIADRVLPSNTGRSYVLRRILRRAVNAGWKLGITEPFMSELVPALLTTVPLEWQPMLKANTSVITSVINKEEIMFLENLKRGMQLLEPIGSVSKVIPGELAFLLHDTFGFPLDLTAVIAKDREWTVDLPGAEVLMQQQRDRGRASWTGSNAASKDWSAQALNEWSNAKLDSKFTGYQLSLEEDFILSRIVAVAAKPYNITQDNGLSAIIVLDESPFYPRGGGQVPDEGFIEAPDGRRWAVTDVQSLANGAVALTLSSTRPTDSSDDPFAALSATSVVRCRVDAARRQSIQVHHTATHLLHAALRNVLGVHVTQAGSLVESKRLRFDFTHPQALTQDELTSVVSFMNEAIHAQINVKVVDSEPLQAAIGRGAMSLFNEKYADHVRTVDIAGYSLELCGGTHIQNTKELFPIHILSEAAIASGVRRIEVIAGSAAIEWMSEQLEVLNKASAALKTSPAELVPRLIKLQDNYKSLHNQLQRTHALLATAPQLGETQTAHLAGGLTLVLHELPSDLDIEVLRKRGQHLRQTHPDAVHVFLQDNTVACSVNTVHIPAKFHASKLLGDLTRKLGGKGGGQADWAQGRLSAATSSAAVIAAARELFDAVPAL